MIPPTGPSRRAAAAPPRCFLGFLGFLGLLAGALPALACAPAGPSETPPEPAQGQSSRGVVLRVDEIEILAEEVRPIAEAIGTLHPEYTDTHLRRLALTNVLIPRAAVRSHHAEERRDALDEARRVLASGGPSGQGTAEDGREDLELQGNWKTLGLDLWLAARGLERGAWSGPIEIPGAFVLAKLIEAERPTRPADHVFTLELAAFRYLPPEATRAAVDAAIDASILTVVDPAWKDCVPEYWMYRMRGGRR